MLEQSFDLNNRKIKEVILDENNLLITLEPKKSINPFTPVMQLRLSDTKKTIDWRQNESITDLCSLCIIRSQIRIKASSNELILQLYRIEKRNPNIYEEYSFQLNGTTQVKMELGYKDNPNALGIRTLDF
jgi:hypothetical protein